MRVLNFQVAYYSHTFAFVHKKKKKIIQLVKAHQAAARPKCASRSPINLTR